MNISYLETLPEIRNKFKVDLQPSEKVVFDAKLWAITSESDDVLGADNCKMILTNRRIIADNGQGQWSIDLAQDVVSMEHMETGKFLSKEMFLLVKLNKEVTYGMGIKKLTGYKFHLGKKDLKAFDEILSHM